MEEGVSVLSWRKLFVTLLPYPSAQSLSDGSAHPSCRCRAGCQCTIEGELWESPDPVGLISLLY